MDLFVIDLVVKKRLTLRKKIENVFLLIIVTLLLFAIIMLAACFVISSFSFKLGLIFGIIAFISMGLSVLFLVFRIIFDFTETGF
jgi:hypothetical protein